MTGNGLLIALMGFLFLFLGYMGVPVAFALIASVLVVTIFTPVSEASMIAQLFNRGVVLAVALCMVYFGYFNFLDGFKSLRMPSMTPMATLYIAIPICGVLVALFTIEQMVNGWRHGFADPAGAPLHDGLGSEAL